jgi:hypothetical protein
MFDLSPIKVTSCIELTNLTCGHHHVNRQAAFTGMQVPAGKGSKPAVGLASVQPNRCDFQVVEKSKEGTGIPQLRLCCFNTLFATRYANYSRNRVPLNTSDSKLGFQYPCKDV